VQLTKNTSIRHALTAMTVALLGTGAISAGDQGKVESSLLLYSETNRVKAAEAVTGFSWKLKGDKTLTAKLTYDALTGASPNGAVPINSIQTFTRPSGQGSYVVKPGELPLDDTFHDTRVGIDASLSQQLNRLTTFNFGGHFSSEYDYLSLGVHAGISRDFNKKNTTLDISTALSHDVVSPQGGIPDAFGAMGVARDDENESEDDEFDDKNFEDDGFEGEGGSSDSKNIIDVVAGITQVIDRETIFQTNYSVSHISGYLNDPFKILSVVGAPGSQTPGVPQSYVYEKRPDSRIKRAIFTRVRRYLGGNAVDISYRYFWDDWGITSHTIDFFYRQKLGGGHALQPHFRWYRQSAADFYRAFLVDGAPATDFASADYRLAKFDAYTIGLQYLFPVAQNVHMSITGEYYSQLGDRSPPGVFGALSNVDIFPDLDVFMVRAGFSYDL